MTRGNKHDPDLHRGGNHRCRAPGIPLRGPPEAGDLRMTSTGLFQIASYVAVILLAVKPLGSYMARVYLRERTLLDPVLWPLEQLVYRSAGIKPDEEMDW